MSFYEANVSLLVGLKQSFRFVCYPLEQRTKALILLRIENLAGAQVPKKREVIHIKETCI